MSITVNSAYSESGGWQNYVSLSLVDLIFMAVFGLVTMELARKRWISCLLFFSICASSILSLIVFSYQYHNIGFIDSIAGNAVSIYSSFSLAISILIIAVAVTPKRILRSLDDKLWPAGLDFIYSCDIVRRTKAVKKGASRCG